MSFITNHIDGVIELSSRQENQVFFAGCLLNEKELQRELAIETHSVEDLLRQLVQKWGVTGCGKISGPFAAVIYIPEKEQYALLRDPLGQKSLFYGICGGYLYFSDQISDVAEKIGRDPNPQGWRDYLSLGYMLPGETAYKGVYRVPSATAVLVDVRGNASCVRYWHPQLQPQGMDWEEAVLRVQTALEASVARLTEAAPNAHLMLSGGVDSTLLLALMSRHRVPVCLTALFDASEYDESSIAARNCSRLKCEHRLVRVTEGDIPYVQERLRNRDELFGDSSLLPTMKAMELAAGEAIVTGSGGDELFGGYRRYRLMLLRQLLGERVTQGGGRLMSWILGGIGNGEQRSVLTGLKRFFAAYAMSPLEGYLSYQRVFRDDEVAVLCPWAMDGTQAAGVRMEERFASLNGSLAERCNLLDILSYLPDDGCEKLNLAAPQNTLVLSPLLDMEVVKVALTLPQKYRFSLADSKVMLRALLKRLAPELTLIKGKKGFGVPVDAWMRKNCPIPPSQILQKTAVDRLQEQHRAGKNPCGARLWTLLMASEMGNALSTGSVGAL